MQSRVSEVLHVDIHPAATIGRGILMDHATGIVIGETAVVGDNVSLLHQVTLGGSGTGKGVRHPRVGKWTVVNSRQMPLALERCACWNARKPSTMRCLSFTCHCVPEECILNPVHWGRLPGGYSVSSKPGRHSAHDCIAACC